MVSMAWLRNETHNRTYVLNKRKHYVLTNELYHYTYIYTIPSLYKNWLFFSQLSSSSLLTIRYLLYWSSQRRPRFLLTLCLYAVTILGSFAALQSNFYHGSHYTRSLSEESNPLRFNLLLTFSVEIHACNFYIRDYHSTISTSLPFFTILPFLPVYHFYIRDSQYPFSVRPVWALCDVMVILLPFV